MSIDLGQMQQEQGKKTLNMTLKKGLKMTLKKVVTSYITSIF